MDMELDKTKSTIISMMVENTGKHILDSGGAYGRKFEYNQKIKDFDSLPDSILSFEYDYIDLTHNVYNWLLQNTTYYPELNDMYTEWVNKFSNDDTAHLQDMENFVHDMVENNEDMFEENSDVGKIPLTINTANGENLLSQILQYTYFIYDDQECILLQLHNGCDIRGGYTAPKAFYLNNEYSIFDNARGSISCESDNQHYWDTDDGYNFYDHGTAGYDSELELNKYEIVLADFDSEVLDISYARAIGQSFLNTLKNETKKIIIDKNGNGYCPICASKLIGYFN